MGLPTYNCPHTLMPSVLGLMERSGLRVEPQALGREPTEEDYLLFGQVFSHRIRRGAGTVYLASFPRQGDEGLTFTLTCGSNPWLWLADMRLLREVEAVCLSHGAQFLSR